MRIIRLLIVLAAAAALSACQPAVVDEGGSYATAQPLALFPDAASVRLFFNANYIRMEEDGAIADGSAPEGGVLLTAEEVATLRASVREGPSPNVMSDCCNPRHLFVFYDAQGHKLGGLSICFECGCSADLTILPASERGVQQYIFWDYAALQGVVEAHELPLY